MLKKFQFYYLNFKKIFQEISDYMYYPELKSFLTDVENSKDK
jgi:hypothetical protein